MGKDQKDLVQLQNLLPNLLQPVSTVKAMIMMVRDMDVNGFEIRKTAVPSFAKSLMSAKTVHRLVENAVITTQTTSLRIILAK